ncbi:DNA replication and repair protein RecF [Riemerella columbipharyngis]|uniref:DNA replication and repair protein RecF n=2 Tax=Riemerella columbipharyngis TaxID=1071918 RepID=A0A1G7BLL1_9FLAO|nr:DNA replication and repair protein RecF [Riemerella columbipharyngis]
MLREFDLSPDINCFIGDNGVGKTNILDALHYLSLGKSFLGNSDLNNIKKGEDFFSIEAEVQGDDKGFNIKVIQPKDARKVIKKNDKAYSKIAEHIGFLPSVMISPYDANLITDSAENRRRFLDAMISQVDAEYFHSIIQYQKALKQRNALLKSFAKNGFFDADSLEIYNEPLSRFGTLIYRKRNDFIQGLRPVFKDFYKVISNSKEEVDVIYESVLETTGMNDVLRKNESKDRVLTYTSQGVHKDDLNLMMDEDLIKKTGSQGQQKSFLIALKLAQMNCIKNRTKNTPMLLLDDIFDKLDDKRVSQLIDLVNREGFGQIFITDTHRGRTEEVVKNINEESRIFGL